MGKYVVKAIIFITILVLMDFFGTSCSGLQQSKDDKIILSSISYGRGSASSNNTNINDEVLMTEQKELYLSSKIRSHAIRAAKYGLQLNTVEAIPVLMYHSIAFEKNNDLRVPKEKFEAQMKYLKENGFNSISMSEAYDAINNGKPVPPKPIVITFDDGYEDNYINAFPILMNYGLTGTIFVITDAIGKGGYINTNQIREMYENDMDFESHTVYHDQLNLLPYDKQLKTLKTSKEYLESILNKRVISIAYPYGKYNNETIRAVKDAGYLMAFTTQYGFSRKSNGMLTLSRVRINASDTISSFASKIGK